MQAEVRTGPVVAADGSISPARGGRSGEVSVADAHARFFEPNFRGTLFSDGIGLTSISNVTYTTGTLGATCTPIAGVWNPSTNTVNLVILQTILGVAITALQATGAGPYVWASSVGNTALTLGSSPFNRKTGVASGSAAKGLANVALTGLTNNLVVRGAAALGGGAIYNASLLGTAAGFMPSMQANLDSIDGSLIVPPGGVLALLATTTPVAHSAISNLIWEEVPI